MRVILGLLFLLSMHIGFGQTVSLPDANLRNKLLTSYPQVMQGNELVIADAATLTGTLDLRNSNISNASGIEYFTSITTLALSNNQLSTIPSISATSGLLNFYASNNKLTSLPDMSALTDLRDFQVMNNQLTALPNLSGATGLRHLYCSSNDIAQFPSIVQFPDLLNLVIGDNPIENSIDFSPCTNLLELHVHKMGIDSIIGLEKLTKLTILYAWENEIRTFSALDSISTLTLCFLHDNPIDKLPYLANKTNLNALTVANCFLTFEDILPVLQQGPPATFTYSPQRSIPFEDVSARAESNFTLLYPEVSPLPGNKYVWVKDGVVLDSSSSPSFTFIPLTFSDSGDYVLKVYNASVPVLVLKTDTFQVAVLPCVEFSLPSIAILSKECGKGYTIDLSNAQISGGTAPFSYELTNGVYNEKSTETIIKKLPAGKFKLIITDANKCTSTDNFILDRIEKCDPVITPNGDGIGDSYFIEKSGTVKIYDLKRRLVNTLNTPVVWDATDHNGALLDAGYYILIMEDENPVYITVIR